MLNASNGTRIVIVGGGAGGLELASALARNRQLRLAPNVVLVDQHVSHLWKPRLHEVAVGLQSVAEEEVSFFSHALRHGYQFEWGALEGVDTTEKMVALRSVLASTGAEILPARKIPYDVLVLSIGSQANDFGTEGAREHCLFLNDREDALKIRTNLLTKVLRLARGFIPSLDVAVIGGGATGVELIADFYRTVEQVGTYGGTIAADSLRLTVIDAGERLLATGPIEVSTYAAQALRKLGVQILASSKVIRVCADRIELANGRSVAADLSIWTAGIKGPPHVRGLEHMPVSPNGRLIVDKHLRTADANIFALGDCASWLDPDTGRAAPFTAQVASAQATYLARLLREELRGRSVDAFRFQSAGGLVALGDKTAAGNLTSRIGKRSREHIVQGVSAKWLYALLYRQHQTRVHGLFATLGIMVSDWATRKVRPTLKLH